MSTALAAITAAIVGTQVKLAWNVKSLKYATVASTYSNLSTKAYSEYSRCLTPVNEFLSIAIE